MNLKHLLFLAVFITTSCAAQRVSTITGSKYDKRKDQTSYFVMPFGATTLPGKWTKAKYNEVSQQQFFKNAEGVSVAIAFMPINGYEFNVDEAKKGFEFVQAFYDWEADYFTNSYKLSQEKIESDEDQHYIIWRLYGESNNTIFDTYFLFGEKNGYASNFSVTKTEQWTKEQKIRVLKEMYLNK